MTNVDLFEQLV